MGMKHCMCLILLRGLTLTWLSLIIKDQTHQFHHMCILCCDVALFIKRDENLFRETFFIVSWVTQVDFFTGLYILTGKGGRKSNWNVAVRQFQKTLMWRPF